MCNNRGMRFRYLIRLVRRYSWATVKLSNAILDYAFLPAIMMLSGSRRFRYGHFNVVLSNVGDDSSEQWSRLQKNVVIACIRIITHPKIDPDLKVLFSKIRTINVVWGRPRRSVMSNRVFLYLGPPSGETGQCVRCFLNDIIWTTKRRDEYFRNCRSTKTSFDMATNYTRNFMRAHCALIDHEVAQMIKDASDSLQGYAICVPRTPSSL